MVYWKEERELEEGSQEEVGEGEDRKGWGVRGQSQVAPESQVEFDEKGRSCLEPRMRTKGGL